MVLHQKIWQARSRHALRAACLLAFLALPITGFASNGKLTLAWDSEMGSDIVGYRLHLGTAPGSYSTHTDVGMTTLHTVKGLDEGTYYFVITAYNTSGMESSYSNELRYMVPSPPRVDYISETRGPSGTEVTITGQNLVTETIVEFGGVRAPIVALNSHEIVVAVPAGFSSGPITVTTPGGSVTAAEFQTSPALSQAELQIRGAGSASTGTIGPSSAFLTGYATASTGGASNPHGIAFLTNSSQRVISGTTGMTASIPTRSARMVVDHRLQYPAGSGNLDIRTGLSLVNSGSSQATVTFLLRDQTGKAFPETHLTLAPAEHQARFLDQFFDLPDKFGVGMLEISSNEPVSVLGLRLTVNQEGRLLMSNLPVSDASKPAATLPLYFPIVSFGDGFKTTVMLFNPSDRVLTGRIHLLNQKGSIFTNSRTPTMSPYRILPGGVFQFATSPNETMEYGWIKVMPDLNSATPSGAEFVTLTSSGITHAETCLPPVEPVRRALLYMDESGGKQTSLTIANPASTPMNASLRAFQDNSDEGNKPELAVPANGALSGQLRDLFQNSIPEGFRGVLEITSAEPFLPVSLTTFANSRGERLFANNPIIDPAVPAADPLVFPQIADGGGYRTDFIFIDSENDSSPVRLGFWDDNGNPIAVGR